MALGLGVRTSVDSLEVSKWSFSLSCRLLCDILLRGEVAVSHQS